MRWSFLLSTLAGVVASSPISERSSDIDTTATSVAGYSGPWDRIEHLIKRQRKSTSFPVFTMSVKETSSFIPLQEPNPFTFPALASAPLQASAP